MIVALQALFTVVCRKYICAILRTRIAQTQVSTNRVGWHYVVVSAGFTVCCHDQYQESRSIASIKLPNHPKKCSRLLQLRKLGYFAVKDGVPTPARAKAIRVLSLLCEYARIDLGWIAHNPCRWPKRLQTGDGYPAWTLAEFQQYMACGQIGEPIKRAAAQAFYTGARVGDCIALPRAARHDGAIEFTPSRTKRTTRAHVVLPVVPEPAAVLGCGTRQRRADAGRRTAVEDRPRQARHGEEGSAEGRATRRT